MKRVLLAISGLSALLASSYPAAASTESVIYSFPNGSGIYGQLMGDSTGHFYGTSYYGGQFGDGYAYQLKEKRGKWKLKTLVQFNGANGANPFAGLTVDRTTGALYGVTTYGGSSGLGTVFSLVDDGSGWSENVLHSFDGADGDEPVGLLAKDRATGILYGTGSSGGSAGCGTVFQTDPQGNFQVLYNFLGGNDGCLPETQLRQGPKSGMLFGSTDDEGQYGDGTLFLLREQSGVWTESVVHQFTGGGDGSFPFDLTTMTSDNASLYGIAEEGGSHNAGVIFQLTKLRAKWQYSVIYTFTGGADGNEPVGLHLDASTGILYGTTTYGGSSNRGVVFKLVKNGSTWSETVLHSFSGGSDGANPYSRPYLDPRTGQLYGTTSSGGAFNSGTAYVVTP